MFSESLIHVSSFVGCQNFFVAFANALSVCTWSCDFVLWSIGCISQLHSQLVVAMWVAGCISFALTDRDRAGCYVGVFAFWCWTFFCFSLSSVCVDFARPDFLCVLGSLESGYSMFLDLKHYTVRVIYLYAKCSCVFCHHLFFSVVFPFVLCNVCGSNKLQWSRCCVCGCEIRWEFDIFDVDGSGSFRSKEFAMHGCWFWPQKVWNPEGDFRFGWWRELVRRRQFQPLDSTSNLFSMGCRYQRHFIKCIAKLDSIANTRGKVGMFLMWKCFAEPS